MILSIAFQFLAAFMAVRLIPLSGTFIAWIFLASGFIVQALRRIVSLDHVLTGRSQGDMPVEILGLIISILMALGIWKFGPLFSEIKRSRQTMGEKQEELLEINRKLEEEAAERRRAEQALKESEQMYRAVADYSYDWEYWIDANGSFRYISPFCKDVSGYDREEFYRDPPLMQKIIHPEDREIYEKHFNNAFSCNNCVEPVEFRIITLDGQIRWVEHACRPVLDAHGNQDGRRSSNRDITERKSVEEKLRVLNLELKNYASELNVTNSELESFSYTLSHDIRNYLTRISLAAQTLKETHPNILDETGNFLIKGIGEACDEMNNLIEAILLLSRAKKSSLVLDTVNLSELAIEVGNDVCYQYPERQVDFTVIPGLVVHGNRELLRVVLQNLLGNAWKYTSQSLAAKVAFGIEDPDGKRVFFVRDNGTGFDMQEADKLFKPFSRLGTAVNYKGVGIGLATVQRIINAHGGEVWGEGELGKGATFYFTLP